MEQFFSALAMGVGFSDIVDILLVAFVAYKILGFIRESRAEQLVKGLLLLVVATFLSEVLKLYTLNWLLKNTMTLGVLALVVVFQPELRRGLEQMGRSKLVKPGILNINKEKAKTITGEFVKAIESLSSHRVGALIVIERHTALKEICETGTTMDADISAELIENVFYEGSPLHDGAVIVRGSKLYAAGCVLPLTENKELPTEMGTRHRAGIGITEKSDALTIIVSEETGIISIAQEGHLERYLDGKRVEKALLNIYLSTDKVTPLGLIKNIFRRKGRKDNA